MKMPFSPFNFLSLLILLTSRLENGEFKGRYMIPISRLARLNQALLLNGLSYPPPQYSCNYEHFYKFKV